MPSTSDDDLRFLLRRSIFESGRHSHPRPHFDVHRLVLLSNTNAGTIPILQTLPLISSAITNVAPFASSVARTRSSDPLDSTHPSFQDVCTHDAVVPWWCKSRLTRHAKHPVASTSSSSSDGSTASSPPIFLTTATAHMIPFSGTDPAFKNGTAAALIIGAIIPLPSPLPLEGDKACTMSCTSVLGSRDKIQEGESALCTMLASALASVAGTLESGRTYTSNLACVGSSAASKRTSIGSRVRVGFVGGACLYR